MLTITLQRQKEYKEVQRQPKNGKPFKVEDSTIGTLTITDENGDVLFACATCENGGPSTDTPNRDKRIPARIYQLYWTESSVSLPQKWKPKCISTCTDKCATHKNRRIHIHIGNYPQDTHGCILLGFIDNGDGTISQSTDAVTHFYNLVYKHGIENFTLEIKEIKE